MQFGNWNVTDTTIEFNSDMPQRFVIEKHLLLETEEVADRDEPLYKWILLATAEDWLTEDDLYDLNFAFVYAAGEVSEDFDYERFDKTVEYQFEIIEGDEDEEEEEE